MTDGKISFQRTDATPNDTAIRNNTDHVSRYGEGTAKDYLYQVCDAAKANGVRVFTIGFEVNGTARKQMQYCASSPSDYFDVAGLDIEKAFDSIVVAIDKLKLTQ